MTAHEKLFGWFVATMVRTAANMAPPGSSFVAIWENAGEVLGRAQAGGPRPRGCRGDQLQAQDPQRQRRHGQEQDRDRATRGDAHAQNPSTTPAPASKRSPRNE